MLHFKSLMRSTTLSAVVFLTCLFSVGQASAYTAQDLLDADFAVVEALHASEDAQYNLQTFNFTGQSQSIEQELTTGVRRCQSNNSNNYVECIDGYYAEYETAIDNLNKAWADALFAADSTYAAWTDAIKHYNDVYNAIYGN